MRSPRSCAPRSPRWVPPYSPELPTESCLAALDFAYYHADHFRHGTCDLWGQTDAMTGVSHFDGEHHKRVGDSSKYLTQRMSATDIDAVRTQPLAWGNYITQRAATDAARR